jgi:hypothetical protein
LKVGGTTLGSRSERKRRREEDGEWVKGKVGGVHVRWF